MKKVLKFLLILCLIAAVCGGLLLGGSAYVKAKARPYTLEPDAVAAGYDCILVLGCGARGGVASPMLTDRLLRGIELYEAGVAPKLLMSGDHGQKEYDEVNVMKDFAIEAGVPGSDVFMDHAGFSTYESMVRAQQVFQVQRVLIVTQGYHLSRAVYDARRLGMEADGVAADLRPYAGQTYRDLREVLARDKDILWTTFRPAPTYLGEAIPISGDGDQTNDRESV
ncbi:MAG: YdcF family protein [Clostridia bacterium]|nr:YdcF family protein [Clostridia bacterium]